MKQHRDSHLDHNITQAQLAHIMERFADRTAFFVETFELPPELGAVLCSLYGPTMGDAEIAATAVTFEKRGTRTYPSRMIALPPRVTRIVTVIAGPHDGFPCVLFTAFGGPAAPKEPGDPTLLVDARAASEAFWAVHALSIPITIRLQ